MAIVKSNSKLSVDKPDKTMVHEKQTNQKCFF